MYMFSVGQYSWLPYPQFTEFAEFSEKKLGKLTWPLCKDLVLEASKTGQGE